MTSAILHPTGRLVQHDPASRAYAAAPAPLRPVSWMHALGPVLDQGQVNGCTGWTAADWLNWPGALASRRRYNATANRPGPRTRYLADPDGLLLYEEATQNDSFEGTYPPDDGGSSGLGAAKAMHKAGIIDRYTWTFDFGAALAKAQRQPVMLGLLWTDAMSDPDAKGVIHIGTPRQVKAAHDSGLGHEVLLRGVNWPRKLARIRNHWTRQWGLAGEAYVPLAELETLIMDYQGDVCAPEPLAA